MYSKIRIETLPTAIREIGEKIGFESAFKLVERCAGTHVCPPRKMHERHWIAQTIGLPAAKKLSELWGGDRLYIPFLAAAKQEARNKDIAFRYDNGESVRSLAGTFKLSERAIWRILKKPVFN
ncbi:MAG: hypothetical protein HQL76_02505 [Magnetococcales bacterium]|nr:hypothetical protein [Magnetococcales bacterium]